MDTTLQNILGRLALGSQLGVVCLLALFFSFLTRAVKLQEIRTWAAAWTADTLALFFVFLTSFLHPPLAVARVGIMGYAFAKTAYAILIVIGARNHVMPGSARALNTRYAVLILGIWSLALGGLSRHLGMVQIGQALMVGTIMSYGGIWLLMRPRAAISRWLGWAMLLQGVLFLHYLVIRAPIILGKPPLARYILYSSFFDAGAELVVALAALVALESSTSQHLRHLNQELTQSQERLRQLVDLDPLTSLLNRNSFRKEIGNIKEHDITLIFIDLDDFKDINDRFGHTVGDACLKRVAAALLRIFRPEDAIFRWGGDEFLVACRDLKPEAASERTEKLRAMLKTYEDNSPPCYLSVGVATLKSDQAPEEALKLADASMYADKNRRKNHISHYFS